MAGGRELPRWAPAALSAGPVALALALRINGLDWGSPDFFEEAIPLRRAWDLWPWLPGETFDGNPHYFRYPSLVLYLNFLLQAAMYAWLKLGGAIQGTMDFRVLREIDPAAFFLPARSLSVAFATGSVWMVGRLGRRLDGALVGTAAALLTAVNVLHVDWSQRISVDMALAFFSLWALLRCVMLAESVTVRRGVLAGVAVGLATSSKYTGALLLVPLLAAVLPTRREAVGPAVRALVAAGAAAAIVFAATSPWVIADFRAAWLDIAAEREHMEVGHFGLSSGAAWPFYAKALAGRLLGPLAAAGAVIGMAAAVLRRDRRALV
ncbi:MAG TPA: glycosyltransferase family 39 protein, partial [bacterium]|nr:glycosyltransferase family 39 protein [bacterium]